MVKKEPAPLPGPEVPLTSFEVDEAFRGQSLSSWSFQRLAIAVLDTYGGSRSGAEVVALIKLITGWKVLEEERAAYWRAGAIVVHPNGLWSLAPEHPAIPAARRAVRDQIAKVRRWKAMGPDPAVVAAYQKRAREREAAHAAELARLRRVLVHAFPADAPAAASIIDLATREMVTWTAATADEREELRAHLRGRLADYDFIAALGVRPLLRALEFDPGDRRLADLGPPQKTMTLNRRGRVLKITNELLVQGSCGISRPFGEPERMRTYILNGQIARLTKRIEADAKSLFALYQYGKLHGAYRLRWGFLDEMLRVSWVDWDEPRFHQFIASALEKGCAVEVVAGSAPGWEEPWKRAVRCEIQAGGHAWDHVVVDEDGFVVAGDDVQMVREVAGARGPRPGGGQTRR